MPPAPPDYRGHVGRRIALRDLEAKFIVVAGDSWREIDLDAIAGGLYDRHGIYFLCPKCFAFNNGPIGTHRCLCWFVGCVPDDRDPKPGRWTPSGMGIDDLTFVPGNPPRNVSVRLTNGCAWHGVVTGGAIESDE